MDTAELRRIFEGARARLSLRHNWGRGSYYNRGKTCLIGACALAAGISTEDIKKSSGKVTAIEKAVAPILRDCIERVTGQPSPEYPFKFNDTANYEDVLHVLDCAVECAAQGIEARQGEDPSSGLHPKDESPVAEGDAP